jgi:hypothetical protein
MAEYARAAVVFAVRAAVVESRSATDASANMTDASANKADTRPYAAIRSTSRDRRKRERLRRDYVWRHLQRVGSSGGSERRAAMRERDVRNPAQTFRLTFRLGRID